MFCRFLAVRQRHGKINIPTLAVIDSCVKQSWFRTTPGVGVKMHSKLLTNPISADLISDGLWHFTSRFWLYRLVYWIFALIPGYGKKNHPINLRMRTNRKRLISRRIVWATVKFHTASRCFFNARVVFRRFRGSLWSSWYYHSQS